MSGEPIVLEADERQLFRLPQPEAFAPLPPAPADQLPVPDRSRGAVQRGAIQRWRSAGRRVGTLTSSALAIEEERGVLFLTIPLLLVLGVFAYLRLPVEPSALAVGVAVIVAAILAFGARSRPVSGYLAGFVLAVVAGLGLAKLETMRAQTKMIGSEVTTRLTARVVEIDVLANGRTRMTVDVVATARPELRFAPDRVRVSALKVPEGLEAGSTIHGLVKLFPPSGPLRPGSYDFAFESYFDGIGGNGFFYREPELVTPVAAASIWTEWTEAIDNFRNRVAQRIRVAIPGSEGEIAAALLVGARAGIPEDANESLRRTGLAHILSISGLHMALVAASVMGALRLAFAAVPGLALRLPVKKYVAAIALIVVSAYLFVSGAEVAARRSYIMIAVMLVAVMADRSALTMRNLAIATIIVVAMSPHEVVGPSFQMSFAATAALIGGYGLWSEWRQRRGMQHARAHMPLWWQAGTKIFLIVAGTAATAIIAGAATTIYGAWHFQRVSPLSLIANLAATPFVTVVMWSGVLAAVTMPFGLDGPFLALMGSCLSSMLDIAKWLSERSPIDAVGTVPLAAVVWFTLALIVAALGSTWLRLLALPMFVLGCLGLLTRTMPDVLISEEGALVAVRTSAGDLAVNRGRPNGFTIRDWQRAMAAENVLKPAEDKKAAEQPRPIDTRIEEIGDAPGFVCVREICLARHSSGALVATAGQGTKIGGLCEKVALIVSADATLRNPCATAEAVVVTAKDLARQGSMSVSFTRNERGRMTASVLHAIRPGNQGHRPWHTHRQFSREARGLAPYQPAEKRDGKGRAAPSGATGSDQ